MVCVSNCAKERPLSVIPNQMLALALWLDEDEVGGAALWPVYNRGITFSKVKISEQLKSRHDIRSCFLTGYWRGIIHWIRQIKIMRFFFSARNKKYYPDLWGCQTPRVAWWQTMKQSLGNWGCFRYPSKFIFPLSQLLEWKMYFQKMSFLHTVSSHFTCW